MRTSAGASTRVYVGTYTRQDPHPQGEAEGIYVFEYAAAHGRLLPADVTPDVPNPSFLALSPDGRLLFAANEVPEIDGHDGGAVSAFEIAPDSGSLTFLNRVASHGAAPCYVSVDHTGRFVLVANYGSGTVALLPLHEDGTLAEASDVGQHAGSGVHPERQDGPHAHAIVPDASGTWALATDLGIDQIIVYRIDRAAGHLIRHIPPGVTLAPGAGPRHVAFHPSAPLVAVINELDSTITTCHWDAEQGTLSVLDTRSTLPPGWEGRNTCADVHFHPSGRFLYGSNRGHDSLALFSVDDDGRLQPRGHVPTEGREPRNFAIDPSGTYLLAANQHTHTIVTFRIDQDSGQLEQTGDVAHVPSPVCIVFGSQ
jgi:6-phosphogluconolactonase